MWLRSTKLFTKTDGKSDLAHRQHFADSCATTVATKLKQRSIANKAIVEIKWKYKKCSVQEKARKEGEKGAKKR